MLPICKHAHLRSIGKSEKSSPQIKERQTAHQNPRAHGASKQRRKLQTSTRMSSTPMIISEGLFLGRCIHEHSFESLSGLSCFGLSPEGCIFPVARRFPHFRLWSDLKQRPLSNTQASTFTFQAPTSNCPSTKFTSRVCLPAVERLLARRKKRGGLGSLCFQTW